MHGKQLHNIAWLLLTDSNVMLYGIGNKQKLLKELVHTFLEGEDVIEVSTQHNSSVATPAPTPEQLIKSILGHIERTVLKNKTIEGAGLSLENRVRIVAGNCCYRCVWFANRLLRLHCYFAPPCCAHTRVCFGCVRTDLLDIHYGRGSKLVTSTAQPALPLSPLASASAAANSNTTNTAVANTLAAGTLAQNRARTARGSVVSADRWGGRYAQAQSRLYLIIHDITGPALCDAVVQQCLATLAQCVSVSIVATLGNLNSIVQWDRRLLAQFGWSYHHYATFERSPVARSSFPLVVPDSALLMPVEGAAEIEETGEGELVDGDSAVKAGPYSGAVERTSADADDTNRAATSKPASAQGGASKSIGKSTSAGSKAVTAGSTKKVAGAAVSTSTSAAAQSKLGTTAPGTLTSTATHNLAVKALDAINKSLTTKHTALLATIVETLRTQARTATAEAGDATNSSAAYGSRRGAHSTRVTAQAAGGQSRHDPLSYTQGVPLMQLYAKLKSSLQVSSVTHLHNLLKEYFDHAVLVAVKHQSEEYLCLKPPFDFLAAQ
jgi:hypothetical protein